MLAPLHFDSSVLLAPLHYSNSDSLFLFLYTIYELPFFLRVNSVVETWVNESLNYLEFSIKSKTPSYRVTVTKWVSIPGDWPKPRDRTIVFRYIIRYEPEESNRNCKFVDNSIFGWLHLSTQKGRVTNTHVDVNMIKLYDRTMVVLEELRFVYDHVIILG